MKNIFKYVGGSVLMLGMLVSCSPDSYTGADENGIALAADYADLFNINVDQDNNMAHFDFTQKAGVMPVWNISMGGENTRISSEMTDSQYYRKAGDYKVMCRVMNRNGVSDGQIEKTFHINRTKMNGFAGFKEDTEFNLWRNATIDAPIFWYAPGWAQIADPAFTNTGKDYSVTLPLATTDQWQAQMKLGTNIPTSATSHYDFSMIITSNTTHPGVTVKLQDAADDGVSYFIQKVALTANEPLCVYASDMAGIDISNVMLVLDFGGNAENTKIDLESIVLKDHANDDGTIVPVSDPEPAWVDIAGSENIWNGATVANTFYYAPDWAQIADPTISVDGRTYTIDLPTATSAQWQAQVMFNTGMPIEDNTSSYDFCVVLNSSQEVKGVTVKLVETNEKDADGNEIKHDDNFFFVDNVDLAAGEDVKFWKSKITAPAPMNALTLVLDFGGNPANTKVKVKDIILQKHKE